MANVTNATLAIEPIGSLLGSLTETLQLLVGGVFGIYVIILILRLYQLHYLKKNFDEIKREIKALKKR
jgi:uncharacterized membrane protein YgaE (UPF0421/DUF939 family)